MIKKITESAHLKLSMAIILLITSGMEIYESFLEFGSEHGIFLFSIMLILQAIVDLVEGADYLQRRM